MTLDDQAQLVYEKAVQIWDKAQLIMQLADAVQWVFEDITLSQEQKQALISKYQTKKDELEQLLNELP